jgi:nucleoside-diphosphate-sugar epimerase
MRVLIVGGAGYVGGWLTDQAVEAGHDVIVYDLLLYEDRFLKDVQFVNGDVLDRDRLRSHLKWADAVVWLAALVGDPASALHPAVTRKINRDSVSWLSKVYDGRIVFPSTCSVYGAQDDMLDELSPLAPLSLYARTKLEAESILRRSHPNALILRLATLAGVGDTYSRIRLDLVVNLLTTRAKTIGKLQVFGGMQYRPLLHVRDVATAVIPHLETNVGGIFNLGTENVTIEELAERVSDHVGGVEIEKVDLPIHDTRNYRTSFEKCERELGFRPLYDIDHAIVQVAELIDAGRVKDLSLAQFSNLESLRPYLRPEQIPFGREIRTAHSLARHADAHQVTTA